MIDFIQYGFCFWPPFLPPSQFLRPPRTSQINTVKRRERRKTAQWRTAAQMGAVCFESAHQMYVFTHRCSTNSESKARIFPTHHSIFIERCQAINSTRCTGRLSYASCIARTAALHRGYTNNVEFYWFWPISILLTSRRVMLDKH